MRRPHLTFSDGQPDMEKYALEADSYELAQEQAFERERDEETELKNDNDER